MPYEGTTTYGETNGSLSHANSNTANMMSNITINNATLTNNGSIIIGGIINGGGGTFVSGHSTGKYSQITLNSSTIENNGSITAYGYIDEIGNSSMIKNNETGSISAPFVVVENRGGTNFTGMYVNNFSFKISATPFNRFYMPNIYPTIRTKYGGKIYGLADLYANEQHNKTTISLIGDGNSFLIRMYSDTIIETKTNNVSNINIYGNISLNSLSISINALGMNVNISTSEVFFPLSWYQNISLYRHEDGSESDVSFGTQKLKIMPGSKIYISEGVNVTAPSIVVYDSSFDDFGLAASKYESNVGNGELTVDGYLNVDNLGGNITTIGSTGKLVVNSSSTVTSKEVIAATATSANYTDWTYKLKLNLFKNGSVESSPTECSAGTYNANNGGWELESENEESGGDSGGSDSCLVEGTLITMADGTKKKVEDIASGDMLLIFNHETGTYDIAPVLFNDSEEISNYTVINLVFSDGTIIKVVSEHGFFDLDLMKYVYINESTYLDYVGHRFYYSDIINNSIVDGKVTLVDSYITTEYTRVYSPVTKYHLNYFTNNLLSMPGGIDGLFNIFEYDENLKYDEEKKQNDIETYGLYTYEDFKDLVSYEIYESFPANYFAVAIGKGLLTWDDIYYYIERYTPLM